VSHLLADHRFKLLLAAIFALSLAGPFLHAPGPLSTLADLLFALMLAATVAAVRGHPRPFHASAILLAFAVATIAAAYGFGTRIAWLHETVVFVGFAFYVVLLLTASATILLDVSRATRVSSEEIGGALCVYMLFGILFALLYVAVERAAPGSFRFTHGEYLEDASPSGLGAFSDFLYFSFVTLTTLGYGDAAPAGSLAQTLAWIEAVVGQIFLAVLVARLVGLQISGIQAGRRMRDTEAQGESDANAAT
jgi:hypothetical protein